MVKKSQNLPQPWPEATFRYHTINDLIEEEAARPSVGKLVITLTEARKKYAFIWDTYEDRFWRSRLQYVKDHRVNTFLWDDILKALHQGTPRGRWMYTAFSDNLRVARRLIGYVKCIPGYKDLNLTDQIILLQGASCDLVRLNRLHIVEDSSFNAAELTLIIGEEEAIKLLKIANNFLRLRLRPEEVAVLSAVLLFNSEREGLQEPSKVDDLYNHLLHTLRWLIHKYHQDDVLAFEKTLQLILDFRTLAPMQRQFYAGLLTLAEKGTIQLPQLLKELASSVV